MGQSYEHYHTNRWVQYAGYDVSSVAVVCLLGRFITTVFICMEDAITVTYKKRQTCKQIDTNMDTKRCSVRKVQ